MKSSIPSSKKALRIMDEICTAKQTLLQRQIAKKRDDFLKPVIEPASRGEEVPLSFAQNRLWFLEQMEGELTAYNMVFAWRLRGALAIEALRRAFEEVVRRHEPLRTTFSMIDEEPVQVVRPMERFDLPIHDLRSIDAERQEIEVVQQFREESEKPFDLTSDRMLRASLLQLAEDEHVLLITMHHIASDGWSVGVLRRELEYLYDAYCRGAELILPDLPVQYVDYSFWQRSQLEGPRLEQLLQYWCQQLDGLDALEFPTDHPRPALLTFRGDHRRFVIPEKLVVRLKSLSRASGVTLHMTLLAAFKTLLARYSGQDDIAVGVPDAGRSLVELEEQIGFFVNLMVLRSDLSGNPTFRELLGRVRQVSVEAYEHQDLPFEKLVEELRPDRQLNRNPLVQVTFQLFGFPEKELALHNLDVSSLPWNTQRARFDLEMALRPRGNALDGSLFYSTDLFDGATIERMLGHFVTLLEGIGADLNQRISDLPLMPLTQRHQLMVEWNDTAVNFPSDKCIDQLFEEQVERTPDAIAVVFEDQQLTYSQLNARANQLAHYLLGLGVEPETLVGLYLERSLELVIGILGVLKAGGAYVPMNPDDPAQRLEFMLHDSGIKYLVTRGQPLSRLPNTESKVIQLDTEFQNLQDMTDSNPGVEIGANNLAYVMYTSGSTGVPKGVEIQHRSIARLVFGNDYATFGPDRVFLQLATPSFDASTFELWGALLHGARLIVAPAGVPDFEQLERLLKSSRVTTLWLTASLFNQLVENYPQAISSLEEILTGGEALSVPYICKAQAALGDPVRFINGYGPTESTTFATSFRIPCNVARELESIPIGRPISNTQVYVLDSHGQAVPIGVSGELYIGGAGVARGYP